MPRKALFTREEITQKAFEIVRKKGEDALTARTLAEALNSSPRPIFTLFNSMEEVRNEVLQLARRVFESYVADIVDYSPAFKEYGRRLIAFANSEVQLFKMLFLNNNNPYETTSDAVIFCTENLERAYGITNDEAMVLLNQCWIYVCGMAMINNGHSESFTDDEINEMLGRQFISTLYFIKSGKAMPVVTPRKRTFDDEDVTIAIDFDKL